MVFLSVFLENGSVPLQVKSDYLVLNKKHIVYNQLKYIAIYASSTNLWTVDKVMVKLKLTFKNFFYLVDSGLQYRLYLIPIGGNNGTY